MRPLVRVSRSRTWNGTVTFFEVGEYVRGSRSGGASSTNPLEGFNFVGCTSGVTGFMSKRLSDPDNFSVGGLHQNVSAWEDILKGHPLEVRIGNWIRTGVNILDFSRPFEGVFMKFCFRRSYLLANSFPTIPPVDPFPSSYRRRSLTAF